MGIRQHRVNKKIFSGLLEADNYQKIEPEDAVTAIDYLNKAKYQAAASYVLPDSVILNPEDWGKIERIKGEDGHYVFGSLRCGFYSLLFGAFQLFLRLQCLKVNSG